ncbi:hypothetical protein I5F48_16600 [Pseudomonas aeruginosa]|nr:hypothetical protein [Pseudomonas aeruginosa]
MKASKPGPKPSGKAKSAAQRMREYRARKAEEALGAEHSDTERERQIRREARAELERVKLEQQRREHTLRKELEACQTEIGRLLGLLRRHGIDPHPGN